MQIKGIKRGKIIEISQDLDIPDGAEVLLEIQDTHSEQNGFWQAIETFRAQLAEENIEIEPEDFENLRDRSPGREVSW